MRQVQPAASNTRNNDFDPPADDQHYISRE